MEKLTLRIFGSLGIFVFLPLFILTFSGPQAIENAGRSFIEWKLQSETTEKIESFKLPEPSKLEKMLGAKAQALREKTESEIELIRSQLTSEVPTILANQLSELRNLDCTCRKKWENYFRSTMEAEIRSLEDARSRLIDFSQVKYMEIVHKLTLDARIFLGANTVVFILLLLTSLMRPSAAKHLFLPATLLFLSTIICSFFYVFEQNWFYTIIYNDYMGFGYVLYLSLVFGFLCDIVFNSANITTEIINQILSALGKAASVVAC